jgi:PAS domain-containing protein
MRPTRRAKPRTGRAVPVRLARRPGQPDEERRVDFIYQPVAGDGGAVTGIFVEGVDVTDAHREAVKRARAEAALRESCTELEMLADALPVLVSYMDSEVRYQFVNKICEDWFPRRREEILGKRVRDIVGEAAYAAVEYRIDAALAGQRVSFEQFMPYKDGPPRHIRVEYVPRIGEGGRTRGHLRAGPGHHRLQANRGGAARAQRDAGAPGGGGPCRAQALRRHRRGHRSLRAGDRSRLPLARHQPLVRRGIRADLRGAAAGGG